MMNGVENADNQKKRDAICPSVTTNDNRRKGWAER